LEEDPRDWDINLDSNLLLSIIMESETIHKTPILTESLGSIAGASEEAEDQGEWLDIQF
jgi:hypothetical protein